MRYAQSGPIIRVKEENELAFHSPECCGPLMMRKDGIIYPDYRCREHNRQYLKHKRIRKTKKKFKKLFNKKRHKFIKMLTFGLPGEKITSNKPVDHRSEYLYGPNISEDKMFEQDHKTWRTELRSRFNKLRRDKWWKAHVDGGIWFYETVLTEIECDEEQFDENDVQMKIHPHFHVILLGPKNLAGPERDFQQLNNLFEKHELGKPSVSVARSKNGNPLNASLNKSLWYLTNYLKKQEHAEGINRGSFGIFNKKSK